MKHAKIVHVLISCLLVASVSAGCGGSTAREAGVVIENLADDAARAADDVVRARQAARVAKDASELRPLLSEVDDAAQQAQRAAEQIGNLQSESQVLAELRSAQRSAEIARVSRSSFNEVINNPELFAAWNGVNNISDDIVGRRINVDPGPEEEAIRQAIQDVIAGSFCDGLVETLNNRQFPDQQDMVDILAVNLQKAVIDLADLDEISSEILSKVQEVVSGEPPDELEQYKEFCGKVFSG
jgi:hypothetical protein